jgi:hypothetical protein
MCTFFKLSNFKILLQVVPQGIFGYKIFWKLGGGGWGGLRRGTKLFVLCKGSAVSKDLGNHQVDYKNRVIHILKTMWLAICDIDSEVLRI